MIRQASWRPWLIKAVALLWVLQVGWLAWHFAPEAWELAGRAGGGRIGEAIRQEDPFYQWLTALAEVMPPEATYVFLDNYEAGKEIEARYQLTPRRHILLPPDVPPSFLFYTLRQERASFLIIREGGKPLGPGAQAALRSPAFHPVKLAGPGLVFRVDYNRLLAGFYD
jgi:hypothetical protein